MRREKSGVKDKFLLSSRLQLLLLHPQNPILPFECSFCRCNLFCFLLPAPPIKHTAAIYASNTPCPLADININPAITKPQLVAQHVRGPNQSNIQPHGNWEQRFTLLATV